MFYCALTLQPLFTQGITRIQVNSNLFAFKCSTGIKQRDAI